MSIVGTNDLHGGVVARTAAAGSRCSAATSRTCARRGRVTAARCSWSTPGDMFQGTLESNLGEGAAVVAAYNALGYTAAAVGNHEFDFGPVGGGDATHAGDDPRGALKARAAEARSRSWPRT